MTIKELEIQLALGSLPRDDKVDLAYEFGTPIKILAILSKDKDRMVRYFVAKNINTPKEILIILSKDKYWDTRHYARKNLSKRKL